MIEDLIARLEAAGEGSWELDGLIFRAASPEGDWRCFGGVWHRRIRVSAAFDTPPFYTTSLDAALTLVPKGAVWHIMTDYGNLNRAKVGPAGRPSATIYDGSADDDVFVEADAETPPLALCIAALKARGA